MPAMMLGSMTLWSSHIAACMMVPSCWGLWRASLLDLLHAPILSAVRQQPLLGTPTGSSGQG